MALIHAIRNLRVPFARGYARKAYYSKKYNVVIKRSISDYTDNQTKREIELFHQMDENERVFFPVVDVVDYRGVSHIVMKKCEVLGKLYRKKTGRRIDASTADFHEIALTLNLDLKALAGLNHFIWKYQLMDLHEDNLAVDNENRLVIIDAGFGDGVYNGPGRKSGTRTRISTTHNSFSFFSSSSSSSSSLCSTSSLRRYIAGLAQSIAGSS